MKQLIDKHKEFAESMRSIMRNTEEKHKEKEAETMTTADDIDEDTRSLQELLEAKFEELFGSIDDED